MIPLSLRVDHVIRGIGTWVAVCCVFMSILLVRDSNHSTFFQIGPNESLILFNIRINTIPRYLCVVFYTILSTIIRTLQQEVVMPWIIQSIQNDKPKSEFVQSKAYEIVVVDVIYRWFDWFMYMNILLAQIDMMIIEIAGNIGMVFITTKNYLRSSSFQSQLLPSLSLPQPRLSASAPL